MADEDDSTSDELLASFHNLSENAKTCFMKKCVLMCKPSQLQLIYADIERILAKDFVGLMPGELSEKIFSYLNVNALCRASSVNRNWRRISNSDKIWLKQCMLRNWLSFRDDQSILEEPESIKARPGSARKSFDSRPLLSYEFKKINGDRAVNDDDVCRWKDMYVRVHHLEKNWAEGLYIVKPVLRGHTQPVTCMDCNGEMIASGSMDSSVRLWDLATCQSLSVLSEFTDTVKCIKLHNDILVAGCSDALIYIHDLATLQLVRKLIGHNGSVDHVCCEGDVIVSASSADRTLRIWSIADGTCLNSLAGHSDDIETMKMRGNIAVTTSWDETVRVWDIKHGLCIHTLRGHTEVIMCCQFDDVKVITGGADGLIMIWDMKMGHLKQTLHGHTAEVYCVEFDEEIIASGSADSTIKIWSIQGVHLHTLYGHMGIVRCLCLWQTKLVSGGDLRKVIIWDTKTGKMLNAVHRHPTSLHLMWTNRTKIVTASPETPGTITVLSYW